MESPPTPPKTSLKSGENDTSDVIYSHLAKPKDDNPKGKNAWTRIIYFCLTFMIAGGGMFSEAYFIFSVGNLKPIWTAEYPDCWATHTTCNSKLSDSISYTQVSGIIFGQLALGFAADYIVRKLGSCLTAGTMLIFGILMTASSGATVSAQFAMFTAVQFLFGIGVGGEYPIASTSANERAESTKSLSDRRGETVVLVFSMQGWGNLVNTLVIAILMAIFGQTGAPYNHKSLEVVWRLSYALGLIPLVFILCWRIWILKESTVWQGKRKALKQMGKLSKKELHRKYGLLVRHYWHRNCGTALSWFVWDFAFYGNRLFQGKFIKIINPTASLLQVLWWTCLNSFIALVGYYFAAFTVDKSWMGRKRMQAMGFLFIGFLFLMCSIFYTTLLQSNHIHAFQFLYYFSSFWGQFGPNATTWLLPAELNPTEVRSACHGFSAAVGKAGALVAGVIFNLVSDRSKFIISAACGLAGATITFLFIPDLTGLDLREGDKRWLTILDGNLDAYGGDATNAKHLSLIERMLGYGSFYKAGGGGGGGGGAATAVGDEGLQDQLLLRRPGVIIERLPRGGDHHTHAVLVAGMVVMTHPEEGAGLDVVEEYRPGAKKEASFQAKSLQYS